MRRRARRPPGGGLPRARDPRIPRPMTDLERFAGRGGGATPAYDEAESLPELLARMPSTVCDLPVAVLVVDDGSRDGTAAAARAGGAVVARHETNRGGGAAVRTAFALLAQGGARVIVTLDADGQHHPAD